MASVELFPNDRIVEKYDPVIPSKKLTQKFVANDTSKKLIGETLLKEIEEIDHEHCVAGDENSFFVCDLGEVLRAYRLWTEKLPQVHAHYAVKCNPDPQVIQLLEKLGANFDCASKNEIDRVLQLGITADRIVYANPCKTNSFVRHARDVGVNLTTVDNAQELRKLKQLHPETGILIRIATDDETAQCRLSVKFGCSVETATNELLPLAKELGLNVRGVAFHVGSGAKEFSSIYTAIKESREIFDQGVRLGFSMSTLDIGGGFERDSFAESSSVVNFALEKYFPESYTAKNQIRVIAEPGRFMVAEAFCLATHVIARRDLSASLKQANDLEAMIYINDGVYGNLNCILFDHQHPQAFVLKHNGESWYGIEKEEDYHDALIGKGEHRDLQKHHFSIWGPTCDGLDCVSSKCLLYANVNAGDWLYFPNLGAYTCAATTSFNGFDGVAKVIHIYSE